MNFILIISDTFRRDHLGCYGNPWIHTPHLDRLAERSIVFDRYYAASFPTVPNRADVLTGRYNFTYLGWQPLPRSEITLPQILSAAGYSTMGIADTPFYMRNGYGYDRGFADFDFVRGQLYWAPAREDVIYGRRYEMDYFSPTTMAKAEQWLERHYKERFFLLIDTWDPHEPWDPPDYYAALYPGYDGQPAHWPCYWDWEEAGLAEKDVKRAHAAYCGEITMVDRWVGRLLERVESLGLMEDTTIIFTSDHGHYFGEHGLFGKAMQKDEHGFNTDTFAPGQWYRSPLFDELTRVPLLISLPQRDPTRIDALVTPPDLMPTILELAGVEVPEVVQGFSLVPLLHRDLERVRDFVVTSWPLYNPGQKIRVVDDNERGVVEPLPSAITDGEWTLHYAIEGDPVERYHTASDPGQLENTFRKNESIAKDLHARFVEFLESMGTEDGRIAPRRRLLKRQHLQS
jgi:arylsulfatase A-like enzyme